LPYTVNGGEVSGDLTRLFQGETLPDSSKFINPTLRGEFIYATREYLRVGIDISDGLYCDLNKLLDYNSTGFKQLIEISDEVGLSGEEYEMLIGFDKRNLNAILRIAILQGVGITIFGEVADNSNRFKCIDHHK
jgi:thiamine-monophosphate kinase